MNLSILMFTLSIMLLYEHPWALDNSDSLPDQHQFWYQGKVHQSCDIQNECFKHDAMQQKCWGYEDECQKANFYLTPECYEHHPAWARTLQDQVRLFWEQGDFGYIREKKMSMMPLCQAQDEDDSQLECNRNLEFCRAKNLYINLRSFKASASNDRYREDIFNSGDVGGHCQLDEDLLKQQGNHKSPLRSWFAELEHYSALPFKPLTSRHCDVVETRPTIFMKLDAGINMYHHFCDFVNLYSSQHMNGSFSTDVNIVMWDTSDMNYGDFFTETWRAFTRHPMKRLQDYEGKKVCFKDAMFPLLARMMRGLYFNMPLVPGCWKTGLFKAFSEHVLHRLGVVQDICQPEQIRITLLIRNTRYRNIINQDELVGAMKRQRRFNVTMVEYNWKMPFLDQLKITHNTDIFIGIHGAGLTHLLFLPDWAAIFELYNTEDPDCYKDLASLRGVKYFTWRRKEKLYQEDEGHHPTLGPHAKFTNYAFSVDEFMRIIFEAALYVENTRQRKFKKCALV